MHELHSRGDPDVKPNVVSYGAVIDCFSKCGDPDAASRADNLLASMIKLHQSDTIRHADLLPNTYVFNCWCVRRADMTLESIVVPPTLTLFFFVQSQLLGEKQRAGCCFQGRRNADGDEPLARIWNGQREA
jgi:pentatricopeptide repeat protein